MVGDQYIRMLLLAVFALGSSVGFTEKLMAQLLEHDTRFATDGYAPNVFTLNPAAVPPKGERYDFGASRQFSKSEFAPQDSSDNSLKSTSTKEAYGLAGVWDIGAGAAIGVTGQREYLETNSQSSNSGQKPQELMHKDYLGARFIVELTNQIRAGLLVRYLREHASIVGSFGVNQRNSFTYTGSLLGYGAGIYFSGNDSGYGAAYMPALRGKGEVLGEEKIFTESGYALFDVYVGKENARLGMSYYRWIHKRDDRDEATQSLDGNRTLNIDGLNFETALFPVHAISFGADFRVTQKVLGRATITQEESEFIFSEAGIPGENSKNKRVRFLRLRGGAVLSNTPKLKLQLGFGVFDRKTDLDNSNGSAEGKYKGSGSELFLVIGTGI